MVNERDSFMHNIIKNLLFSNNFNIRVKGIKIVFYILNLNSADINISLLVNEIISILITINLLNEEDEVCLKNILNSIQFFINNLKFLKKSYQIDVINYLLKIGFLDSIENNNIRFNEEHNLIINQIIFDIKLILNGDENNKSGKISNSSEFMVEKIQNNNNENNKISFLSERKNI